MSIRTSPSVGQLAPKFVLIGVDKQVTAYFAERSDPTAPAGPVADRVEAPATVQQKWRLVALSPKAITSIELAGDPITGVSNQAPANGAPIGGIKVVTQSGWYAARRSGAEDIYRICAESFQGTAHLQRIMVQAQATVDTALASPP